MAVDESKLYVDEPLGDDYLPVVTRTIQAWPQRVLVLPIAGQVEDEARALFEAQFVPTLRDKTRWILTAYPGVDSTRGDLPITEAQALAKAQAAGADSILFVKLSQERIYPPLRLVADVFLQDVATQKTILTMHADYDAGNNAVADSARRYAKHQGARNDDSPDRSRAILSDLRGYLGFTGYDTAKLVANAFLVPDKKKTKAQAVDNGQPSGGFATPPASLGGGNDTQAQPPQTPPEQAPAPDPTPAPAPPQPQVQQPDPSAPANTARPGPVQ